MVFASVPLAFVEILNPSTLPASMLAPSALISSLLIEMPVPAVYVVSVNKAFAGTAVLTLSNAQSELMLVVVAPSAGVLEIGL